MVGLDSAAVAEEARPSEAPTPVPEAVPPVAPVRSEDASRWLKRIGWLAAAMAIALGGGGVAAFGDHLPGDATRPELTGQADAEALAAMAPLRTELADLELNVTRLGRLARSALGSLNAHDAGQLRSTLAEGDELVVLIRDGTATARQHLGELPYRETSEELGQKARDRIAAADRALDAVPPVIDAWRTLAEGARPAATLIALLDEHDKLAFAATQQGVAADYAGALTGLDEALGVLDRAGPIRDRMAATVDVGTLDDWLERNRAYDEALKKLYTLLRDNGGQPSEEVSDAFAEVERAQELLPPDTRTLVVIMGDIAGGGLNQAALAIDTARGRLVAATSALN